MFTIHEVTSRLSQLRASFDGRRNINEECNYPTLITSDMYNDLYEREGIAQRVVNIMPDECFDVDFQVLENDEENLTAFEEAWVEFDKETNIASELHQLDALCGIGFFGVILLGFDDGGELEEPVKNASKLLYTNVCYDPMVTVASWDVDKRSVRFNKPETYNITFMNVEDVTGSTTPPEMMNVKVHWTRIIHAIDGRRSNVSFGTPRMKSVFNRILDLRKLLAGAAEMFWKGAYPGFSFEVSPGVGDSILDEASLRTEFYNYANGLQRYIGLSGVTTKSMSPQVSPPGEHIRSQFEALCASIAVPLRIFLGSEEGRLAADQDSKNFLKRVVRRREKHCSPYIIMPFVRRMIELGVLPTPKKQPYVKWTAELNPLADQADVASKITTTISTYISGKVDALIPPLLFLTEICGFSQGVAEEAIKQSDEFFQSADQALLANVYDFAIEDDYLEELMLRLQDVIDSLKGITVNVDFSDIPNGDKKLQAFQRWFRKLVRGNVLNKTWAENFIRTSYKKGLDSAITSSPTIRLTEPRVVNEIKTLFMRNYAALQGFTAEMEKNLTRILSDGIVRKLSNQEIADNMVMLMRDMTPTRAISIVNTELANARSEAQLTAYDIHGVKSVTAKVEFSTMDDELVCPRCQKLEGKVYTIAKARGIIPVHVNCRCSWLPVNS